MISCVDRSNENENRVGDESMTTEWHYARNGERLGPVAFDELKQIASAGLLSPNDLVWCEGMSGWETASRITRFVPRCGDRVVLREGEREVGTSLSE